MYDEVEILPVPFRRGRGVPGEIEEAVAGISVRILYPEEIVGGKEVSGVVMGQLGIYAFVGVGRVGDWWRGCCGGGDVEGE